MKGDFSAGEERRRGGGRRPAWWLLQRASRFTTPRGGGEPLLRITSSKNLSSTTRWRLLDSGWRQFPLGWITGLHLREVEKVKLLQREAELSRRLTAIQPAKLTCCIRALQPFPHTKLSENTQKIALQAAQVKYLPPKVVSERRLF